MFEEIQHFGVTVNDRRRSRNFYSRALRLPLMGEAVNSGEKHDRMYGLSEAVNRVTWYQIGDGGMETFYLPRHHSRAARIDDIRNPGYRYMAFLIDAFDDMLARLGREGLEVHWTESCSGRCARVQDPDGIHVLLFDSGNGAPAGRVSALKEVGLVVSDPDGYEKFFDIIGLWKLEGGCDFLGEMFGLDAAAPLYGHVRLIHVPGAAAAPHVKRCFPATGGCDRRDAFSDAGIKHVAYYVADIDAFHDRARAEGVHFLFEPADIPFGGRIAYFLDPEGNTFEAYQINHAMRTLARAAGAARRAQIDLFSMIEKIFDK